MAVMQWLDPTPEQVAEAGELAARLSVEPYWQGNILCVGHEPEAE